jgi:hypothetical protein
MEKGLRGLMTLKKIDDKNKKRDKKGLMMKRNK